MNIATTTSTVAQTAERIIGRRIAPTLVRTMLGNLGFDNVPTLAPDEACPGRWTDGLVLRRSSAMNDYRVELIGFTDAMVPRLKTLGLIAEIISWKLRLFISKGGQGSALLGSFLEPQTQFGVTNRTAAL